MEIHKGKLLRQFEVNALEDGAEVVVTWPNDHTPHRARIINVEGVPHTGEGVPLTHVGKYPKTQVSLVSSNVPADIKPTMKMLAHSSISDNTRESYAFALKHFNDWLSRVGLELSDTCIAAYVTSVYNEGKSVSSASMAVAALDFKAKVEERDSPVGSRTRRVLSGFRRKSADRGRGQAKPITKDQFEAIVDAVEKSPRQKSGRGMQSVDKWQQSINENILMLGLMFHCGMRISEVEKVCWNQISFSKEHSNAVRVWVKFSKTNQLGESTDVRYMYGRPVEALKRLAQPGDLRDRILNITRNQIWRRFKKMAELAGIEDLSPHSCRVGLASELASRGASIAEIMLAGGWKSPEMAVHYASGANAEKGAVAKYFMDAA